MSTFDTTDRYYSGQGVVMIGSRDASGKPKGLVPVGNVSALKIALATTVLEHKDSHTGQRAVDLRLTTENKASLSMTLENFNPANLARALRADITAVLAGAATVEAHKAYPGGITPLDNIGASSVVLTQNSVVLTQYTNDSTPYDYKVNLEAGSVLFNDGAVVAQAKLGTVISAISVGASTVYTLPNSAAVGDTFIPRGVTGADAAFVNGVAQIVTAADATSITTGLATTAKTLTTAATTLGTWSGGMAFTAAYNYVAQNRINAMTQGADEAYLRFEGLNTADGNEAVVVEVFKFSTDPLKELSLIGDGIGQFVLEGSVLSDSLQATGSKFFKQTMLT